jgi:acyl-CoA reductase-like NAD-dependent aldehyde dehydrogenase
VVTGDGTLGQTLIRSGIDACVFTGSTKTGKLVQQACAEAGIPFSAEMGGKDPAIVLADCDLGRTTAGITYWALHNAGQSCAAVEVAYVHEDIADRFVDRLRCAWQGLRTGPEADVAPLAQRQQYETVCRHVADARTKGAQVVIGGHPIGDGPGFEPTVLDHCREEMDVVREETFGPVLPIVRVRSADEAVERANRASYGLTASIWSEDLTHAERLASRLDYGVVTINNHALGGAIPRLPLSGTRGSGYSVANSELALITFVRPRVILIDRHRKPELYWMPFDSDLATLGEILCDAQTGSLSRIWRVPLLIKKRVRRLRRYFS